MRKRVRIFISSRFVPKGAGSIPHSWSLATIRRSSSSGLAFRTQSAAAWVHASFAPAANTVPR